MTDLNPASRLAPVTPATDVLFVYGTLRFPRILTALLGRAPAGTPATVTGWRTAALRDRPYPGLVRAEREEDGAGGTDGADTGKDACGADTRSGGNGVDTGSDGSGVDTGSGGNDGSGADTRSGRCGVDTGSDGNGVDTRRRAETGGGAAERGPRHGTAASGLLLRGLTAREWRVLDDFEDDAYELRALPLDIAPHQAWAYVWAAPDQVRADTWDAEVFAARQLDAYAARLESAGS